MTEAQLDDLIIELSLYPPSQIRKMVNEYRKSSKRHDGDFPFYEFLKERIEIEGYWKKCGLA